MSANDPGCRRCGSENLSAEFEVINGHPRPVRLVCDDCGAKGERKVYPPDEGLR